MCKLIGISLIFILSSFSVYPQLYNFKNYSYDQGLPESKINSLGEDKNGNIWIATTGGLIRFDGYTFSSFREEDGLMNNVVNTITRDASGKMWIGTEAGVYIYDGRQFSFFKPLGNKIIAAIVIDASGNVWIGTKDSGLYKYDGKILTPIKTGFGSRVNDPVRCLHVDSHVNVWIGTSNGIARYSGKIFEFFTKADGLPAGGVNSVTEDSAGNIWIATEEGAAKYDGKEFLKYIDANGVKGKPVYSVMCDQKGNVWFSTSKGISKFDGKIFRYTNTSFKQRDNAITCSFKDSEGNLWFGTSEGLSKLESERFTHYPENDQMGKRVYSIIQAINGNIICGTSLGGTTVFDGQQYSLLNQREGFTSSIVQCFYYSSDSSLWIGTQDDGVFKFGKSDMQHYTKEEGMPIDNITGFALDRKQNLWVVSADSGIVVLTTLNDSLKIHKKYNRTNGLPSDKISGIMDDGAGSMWMGTADAGIIRINYNGQEVAITNITSNEGLNSNTVHSVISDSLHRVYVGTARGINVYDRTGSYSLSKDNGLSSNTVYSLALDRTGNLWAGTERGVDMIRWNENFSSATIRYFGTHEGFRGLEVYKNSSCVDSKGNIWFGTINGLVKYDPTEDPNANAAPVVNITGIKLFFDKIEDTKYGDSLTAWFPIPVQLELPHHQNNLTFSYVGIFHRNPQAVRYKWMLEGFRQEWSPPVNEREAIFSNLPPGDYTFKVIACNENNIWNTTPASFHFSITPPLWERWWVRAAGFAVVILVMWMVFYFRLQRVKTKNKIVNERLEMEKSILELEQEAARLQMNPHFIFNSLNSIQGFVSTNDPFQAKRYLAKFAKLMRLILENAREEFIPLQNEINILENYLELEKLTTQPPFEFSITHDESVDAERIQIPPMMIQPFVENAIIHGIRKKETAGLISIHFKIEGDILNCIICDNGIGRKRAAEINLKTRGHHKSTAIPITRKRLEQYGNFRQVKAGVEITDMEENGNSVGTKVIVSTPFESF
jgi:ligand-binding sensor domain-containing protein